MKISIKKYGYLALLVLVCYAFTTKRTTPIYFEIPKGWPKPTYDFSKNELTEEGFQLGRNLFYDPILSRDNSISCASCHQQATGFTHVDHDLSHGIDGKIGTRNSLALVNLAWSKNFMWDGGVNHLELQPLAPITSATEMDENLENIVQKLKASRKYQVLFKNAFGRDKITGQNVLKSLAQFLVLLQSSDSKYDEVMNKKDSFSENEEKGYLLFQKNCATCHTEPLFTNNGFEKIGLDADADLQDSGRMKITQNPNDSLKFKVPTLRNIQFTFPYMHDGRFKTLTEVIKNYSTPKKSSKNLASQLVQPMHLSDNDRTDLLAFLKTLSDKKFLFDPRFSFPQENKTELLKKNK